MSKTKKILWPVGAGLAGSVLLTIPYFGIVSLAESPQLALDLFWQDRWILFPITLGFGVQMALYVILKKRLFIPVAGTGPSTILTGTSGGMSTAAMVACCAHHVADVLPILGLTAAATFLTQYRIAFMRVALGTTSLGVIVMLVILFKERRKALQMLFPSPEAI